MGTQQQGYDQLTASNRPQPINTQQQGYDQLTASSQPQPINTQQQGYDQLTASNQPQPINTQQQGYDQLTASYSNGAEGRSSMEVGDLPVYECADAARGGEDTYESLNTDGIGNSCYEDLN